MAEGDVLMPQLVGQIAPWLLAIASAVLGGWWALLKWFAARLLTDIEKKLARVDSVAQEVERVDGEVKRLLAELPLHYQRRDDAIREYTAINAKLDRLYEVIMESRRV